MSNEKMMILNMLQEGKITADEAARLLASVGENDVPSDSGGPPPKHRTDDPRSNDPVRPAGRKSGAAGNVDFDEIGRKFASFARDLEPKIQKATEFVAEKTVNIADRISKTIESNLEHDAMPRMPEGSAGSGRSGGASAGTEQSFELLVEDGYNELNLSGLNADVHIKGYNGDKISARIRYQPNRGTRPSAIELVKLGGRYYLNYEEDDFQFVSIDAYVPSHKFKVVTINGINGNMELSAINCNQLQISNSNGQALLSELTADSIKSESGNGRLTLENITASTAVFEHLNGAVEAAEIDVEKLSVTNFNGTLSVSTSAFKNFMEYLWNVETSNAKLALNVPALPDLGYHIRAQATLGSIRIGLSGMEYLVNEPSRVEARNAAFDKQGKKIRLSLETSNAALTVN